MIGWVWLGVRSRLIIALGWWCDLCSEERLFFSREGGIWIVNIEEIIVRFFEINFCFGRLFFLGRFMFFRFLEKYLDINF